ncbi:hypothetical protein KC726_04240 [Candidatus Woesebacteria bacterium]|nr:hypothetical protein [Candidatus Woesebacteria bacterium]
MDTKIKKYFFALGAVIIAFIIYVGLSGLISCKNISQDEATALIAQRPEVLQYVKRIMDNGAKTYHIDASKLSEKNSYLVHVYEIVGTETDGHTATFNWYDVDQCSGEITPTF